MNLTNTIDFRRYYLGLGLVALTTLSIQIAFTRLMSFVTWYHLAFFSISTCMLGMTAGAVRVYLRPDPRPAALAAVCLRYGLSTLLTVAVLCNLPIQSSSQGFALAPVLMAVTILMAAPFYFAGGVVAQVLSNPDMPCGRLYASDLLGAALGCLFVLAAMTMIDVPSLLVLCAGVAVLAGVVFFPHAHWSKWVGGLLVVAALVNAVMPSAFFYARHSKGNVIPPADRVVLSRWNSFSQVLIGKPRVQEPVYWGKSPVAPSFPNVESSWFIIDGLAGTPMSRYRSNEDIKFLKFDVTNVANFIRPTGPSAVIGVGGGRDVQSALLFGHESVTAVEVNPIIVDAHRRLFSGYARIAGNPAVKLVQDDGRSYMARTKERFSVLQMSMVDTWAATGAGAFSLTENGLYTVEAWKMFLHRLKDDGVLTVSRWHNPQNLGETGRVVSVAMAALFEFGVKEPARHLAMITSGNISTLIMSRNPLSDNDIDTLNKVAASLHYTVTFLPGQEASHSLLKAMLAAKTEQELTKVALESETPFNVMPSTDDSPFFFNMLKTGAAFDLQKILNNGRLNSSDSGVLPGNLQAEYTLLLLIAISLVLAVMTTVVPLVAARRTQALRRRGFVPSAVLFSMIGLGFMFIEIGMMQRLSAFLGQPVYALAIVLFSIILATGIGSFLSDRLKARTVKRIAFVMVPISAALPFLLALIIASMETSGMTERVLVSILFTLPFGLVMGMFFPTGLRLTREMGFTDTAWFWSLNGVCGTVASGVAVYVSIHFGISATILCATVCYFVAALAMSRMGGNAQ